MSAVHLILTVYLVYRPNWACDEEYYFHRDMFFGRFLNELCRYRARVDIRYSAAIGDIELVVCFANIEVAR